MHSFCPLLGESSLYIRSLFGWYLYVHHAEATDFPLEFEFAGKFQSKNKKKTDQKTKSDQVEQDAEEKEDEEMHRP